MKNIIIFIYYLLDKCFQSFSDNALQNKIKHILILNPLHLKL